MALDADILCLQEVNAQPKQGPPPRRLEALDRLLADTAYAGFARAASEGPGGRGPADVHNLVTLSRFPILASRQYRNDLVPPPLVRRVTAVPPDAAPAAVVWDRPVLHSVHDVGGRRVEVLNVHLRAPIAAFVPGQKLDAHSWASAAGWAEGFYLAALKRTGQALEARLAVDRIFDADPAALVAVCGDFNAELAETPLRAVRAAADDTLNGALAARALTAPEAVVPESRRYTVLHGGRRVALDHLLVSAGLARALVRAEIRNEGLADELDAFNRGAAIAGSFHAPVVAEFELR